MSGTGRVWNRVEIVEQGQPSVDRGSGETPFSEFTVETTGMNRGQTFNIAAGAEITLWDWDLHGDFTLLGVEADGYLWLATNVDAPTSASDNNDAGTSDNWAKEAISNIAPRFFQSMLAPVNTSAANYAASAFHAATATGRIYKITAKNPGTETRKVTVFWR